MNPTTPLDTDTQPTPIAPPTDDFAAVRASKRRLIWGLVWLIGPTALLIVTILLYAIGNFIAGSAAPSPSDSAELFSQPSIGTRIINILLFLVGGVTVLTWLPGIIIGIVLLTTRKKPHAQN